MNYDSYTAITAEREGRILRLTLSRPESLNAIDAVLHEELSRIFFDVDADDEADVVILTGAGKAFCAGGDLQWLNAMHGDPAAFARTVWEGKRLVNSLLDLQKPIIARLPGHAIGLGCTIALFCDIIYAAENAKLGDPHVAVGLVAGDGGAVIWPQLIGYARAKEYLFTGDLMSATEAERIGLINHVVSADELDDKVYSLARRLASGASKSIRWTKQVTNIPLRQLAHSMMDLSISVETQSNFSSDHQEAVTAFTNKRKPNFTGG